MLSLFDLSGKTALITGGSRGLGKTMAMALAEAGANVVITDVLDTAQTVKEIEATGTKVLGMHLNVTSSIEVESTIRKIVDELGRVDILINNAGVYYPTPMNNMTQEAWDKTMAVNLNGTLYCCRAVGQQMIKQGGGSIINMASISGLMAFTQLAAYNVSKAAIIMLTKTLAVEWAQKGIRVNTICPGVFDTDMTKQMLKDPRFQALIHYNIPMKRPAAPEELKGTALYLASDASSYTTGHTLVVDGGWTVGLFNTESDITKM